ncbi:MAG: hypothetical protein DBY41_05665 [Clostridium sp.]|nr:MAG: hypothetical protein DBY41_05665 [Clostridium sp.]
MVRGLVYSDRPKAVSYQFADTLQGILFHDGVQTSQTQSLQSADLAGNEFITNRFCDTRTGEDEIRHLLRFLAGYGFLAGNFAQDCLHFVRDY